MKIRESRRLWIAVAATFVISTVMWAAGSYILNDAKNDEAQRADVAETTGKVVATEGDDLAARVQAACRKGGDAAKALADLDACAQANKTRETIKDAPVEPEATPVPQQARYVPVPGSRGPGPTLAQIGRAVARVIDDVVADQIDEAVADQLQAALLRACGGSCNGVSPAPAKDGKDGTNGKDAPRIVSIACDDTTGIFTFDDGSAIRVAQMCADEPDPLEPDPGPDPQPEPSPDDSGLLTP